MKNKIFIAKICGIVSLLYSFIIFYFGILPIFKNRHKEISDLMYYSYGFKFLAEILYVYFSLVIFNWLIKRSKIAWQFTFIMVITLLILHLVIWQNYIVLISTLSFALLLFTNRKIFNQEIFISYLPWFVISLLVFAILYGVTGVYILRHGFNGVHSLNDALYFCFITYSTVGYGDVYPITTLAKNLVITMIIIKFILLISGATVITFKINAKLKTVLNNLNKGKFGMENHIVIIADGNLAKIFIKICQNNKQPHLTINLKDSDDHNKIFLGAEVEFAEKIIIFANSDESAIFNTLSIKEFLNKTTERHPKIYVRILYQDNITKAKIAGADIVISPEYLLAQQILNNEI
ncbi:MAG: ion channel [Burkholderiales bacterium]|nr:ion channel [Burkholderiales bacterium]